MTDLRNTKLSTSRGMPEADLEGLMDWEHLHSMSDNCAEFELELLGIFVEDTQSHIDAIGVAISSQNFLEIIQEAHHIKGASANVGVKLMRSAAEKLEVQARQQTLEDAMELLTQIREVHQRIHLFVSSIKVPG